MAYALSEDQAAASIELNRAEAVELTNREVIAVDGPRCAVCGELYREAYHSPCRGEPTPPPVAELVQVLELPPELGLRLLRDLLGE